MQPRKINIDLGDRSYEIVIVKDFLSSDSFSLNVAIEGRKAFLITDHNVLPYAHQLQERLSGAGASSVDILDLPSGEQTKSYDSLVHVHSGCYRIRGSVIRLCLPLVAGYR